MIGNLMWGLRVQNVWAQILVMDTIPIMKLVLRGTLVKLLKLSVPLLLHLQNGLTTLVS